MRVKLFVGSWAVCGLILVAVQAETVRHPLNTGIALEYGQIYHSLDIANTGDFLRKFTVQRPAGWFFQGATIDDRIDLTVGLGATFFILYTDAPPGDLYHHLQLPALALAQATGSYTWGDLKDPTLKLTAGFIPYKYNADAANLGEYLLRASPYPGSVLNSSFNLVNGAQTKVTGAMLSKGLMGGKWKNDLIFSSSNVRPLYDLSLVYVTSYNFGRIFEIGAGVNLHHLIPVDGKYVSKKDPLNAYFNYQGRDYYAFPIFYTEAAALQTGADSVASVRDAFVVDSLINQPILAGGAPLVPLDYYKINGTMLMGRFSLDLRPILGEKMNLKLYGEWAWLGVKNYPVFYEKAADRMPLMLGLHIPTFGLLDVLGVEVEHWKNPYFNSFYPVAKTYSAVPNFDDPYTKLGLDPTKRYDKDDLSWSVTATRSLGKTFSLTAKAARDHLTQFTFAQALPSEMTTDMFRDNQGWYYVLRLQMAI